RVCARVCLPFVAPALAGHSTLSLHDALPIFGGDGARGVEAERLVGEREIVVDRLRHPDGLQPERAQPPRDVERAVAAREHEPLRSEEHTSELQSRENLVCRLLLEKKNKAEET